MGALKPFVPGRVQLEDDTTRRDREFDEAVARGEYHLSSRECPHPEWGFRPVYCDCDK